MSDQPEFLRGKLRRPLGGLRIDVHGMGADGDVTNAWGIYVRGDFLLDPFALKRELHEFARASGADVDHIEERGAFSTLEVAHYVIHLTAEGLYAAILAKGFDAFVKKVKESRLSSKAGPPRSREEILAESLRRAEYLVRDTYRNHFETLTLMSSSLSEPAKHEDASATIVFLTQDGAVTTVHLWTADGDERYTINRVERPDQNPSGDGK